MDKEVNDIFEYVNYLKNEEQKAYDEFEMHDRVVRRGYGFENGWYLDQHYDAKKKYDNISQSVRNMTELIESKSSFKPADIGPAIAKLISYYEGEEYVYQDLFVCFVKEVMTRYVEEDEDINTYPYIISKKEKKYDLSSRYLINDVQTDIRSLFSDAVILGYDINVSHPNFMVKLYDKNLNQTISFKDFEYVYDFINYLISYFVAFPDREVSGELVEKLLDEYLKTKKNEENYARVIRRKNGKENK